MSYTKKGLLLAIAVLACSALFGAGSASATVLCKTAPASNACPVSDVIPTGTNVSAQTVSGTGINFYAGSSIFMQCASGTFSGSVSNAGGPASSVVLSNSTYNFTGCSFAMASVASGTTSIDWKVGTHNGLAYGQGSQVQWTMWGVKCTYTITSPIEVQGGSNAKIKYNKTAVTKVAGGTICPNSMTMEAEFAVQSPAPLYVEAKPAPTPASVLCKTNPANHDCAAGDTYGVGTSVSAQSAPGTSFVFSTTKGEAVQVCESSSFSGTVSNAGGGGTSARLSGTQHTLSSCSSAVTPLTTGEMKVDWDTGTHDGVTSEIGGENRWTMFGVNCTYSIAGPGSLRGGPEPMLVYDDARVVKTAGGFLCPSELKLDGEYVISSPTPLYVEEK
jgi:hypothetical protein